MMRARAVMAFGALLLVGNARADTPSCEELVRQGRAYEASSDQDRALARYGEAIQLDGACGVGYLAMGELRAHIGDGREAERVLSAGLERVPRMRAARLSRARVRRAMGMRADAEDDIRAIVDDVGSEEDAARPLTIAALRAVAGWYEEDRARPAELAAWRRILFMATRAEDATVTREATAMVRALTIVVGIADPVTAPARRDPFRLMLARVAR